MTDAEIADQLSGWGKIVMVETVGRITARPARAGVGFVQEADGSLLVAAGDASADWALNLQANTACRLTMESRTWAAVAEQLEGPERFMAIRELILKYGTPAERLGAGPAFRLRPAGDQASGSNR
jgi:deazaflavin-dependent oxidoreductase (nitroreductase family)